MYVGISEISCRFVEFTLMSFMTVQHCMSDWMTCTLCRTQKQSNTVLKKAAARRVEWPRPKPAEQNPIEVCQVLFVSVCCFDFVSDR